MTFKSRLFPSGLGSLFFSKQFFTGAVGNVYQQVTAIAGQAAGSKANLSEFST
jgi:hypothetical protein